MARAVFLWFAFAAASCAARTAAPNPSAGSGGAGTMGPMMGSMRELMDWMNGAELSGRSVEPRPEGGADLVARGARLFDERCAVCHGEKGDGSGREAARLDPRPRDFTRGTYELRSTPTGSLPTDEDLFATISRGMHGTAMLPWISLSERDRWALAAYLKTLSPRFATTERPASPVAVPQAPPETQALVEEGRRVYQRMQCASCHGAVGHGDGPSVPALRDDHDQPVRPPDFALGRFERGTRMEDLYLTLHTGLDGSPMPSYDGALTPHDTWALAAYVRSLVAERPKSGMMCPMMGGDADPQERLGMMIDMPGMPSSMGGMRMDR